MSPRRLVLILLVVLLVWAGAYAYVGARLISPSRLVRPYRQLAWLVLGTVAFGGPLALFSTRLTPKPGWYPTVAMAAYCGMGLMLLLVPLLAAKDLGVGLGLAALRLRSWLAAPASVARQTPASQPSSVAPAPPASREAATPPAAPRDPARREWLGGAFDVALLGLAGSLSVLGFAAARRSPPGVVHVEVSLDGLPQPFDGFRIVQISDLHLGASLSRAAEVARIVETVNAQGPDLIAVTGDLADGHARELRADAAPLAGLRAPDGVYFVTGNHEYYWDLVGWLAAVETLGFTHLLNEHRVLRRGEARLVIAGVPDITAASMVADHVSDPQAALRGAPRLAPKILLAHQPRSVHAAERAGADLQLSGHTHGGQFWPWTWLIRLVEPFPAGLFRVRRTWLYVNRGTGTWGPPMRLGMPSEITVVTLRTTPL